jgi:hypothetical protein
MGTSYPGDVQDQATEALSGWKKITPPLGDLRDLNQEDMTADLAAVQPVLTQIAELDAQITDLRNKRDVICSRLWDKTKRVRSAVKGLYGDDSSEYEMVGGKRRSEHKPRTRKPKTV